MASSRTLFIDPLNASRVEKMFLLCALLFSSAASLTGADTPRYLSEEAWMPVQVRYHDHHQWNIFVFSQEVNKNDLFEKLRSSMMQPSSRQSVSSSDNHHVRYEFMNSWRNNIFLLLMIVRSPRRQCMLSMRDSLELRRTWSTDKQRRDSCSVGSTPPPSTPASSTSTTSWSTWHRTSWTLVSPPPCGSCLLGSTSLEHQEDQLKEDLWMTTMSWQISPLMTSAGCWGGSLTRVTSSLVSMMSYRSSSKICHMYLYIAIKY